MTPILFTRYLPHGGGELHRTCTPGLGILRAILEIDLPHPVSIDLPLSQGPIGLTPLHLRSERPA